MKILKATPLTSMWKKCSFSGWVKQLHSSHEWIECGKKNYYTTGKIKNPKLISVSFGLLHYFHVLHRRSLKVEFDRRDILWYILQLGK